MPGSLAAAAECSDRLQHLSHNIIKPNGPLPALRAVGVGSIEVPQLDLHTRDNTPHLGLVHIRYLSPGQLVLADDDQQRHAALQRLRQLLLELGVFGVAAAEQSETDIRL